MKTWPGHLVGVGLLVGCLIVGGLFVQRTTAQQAEPAPAPATAVAGGRYQLFGRDRDELILIDTAGGKCWLYQGCDDQKKRAQWVDMETPPSRK